MDGSGLLFAPFIAALNGAIPVVALAYPNDRPLGYDALREWVLSALPPTGSFVFLGESFSGPIATALAAALPERTRGLVLCCTFVRNPRPRLAWLKALAHVLPPPPARAVAAMLFGRFSTPALRSKLTRALASLTPAVMQARLRAVIDVDESAALAAISAPVLCLRATQDRLVPEAAFALLLRLAPQARVIRIEGPHALLQSRPVEAAQTVVKFVREIGALR